MLGLLTEDHPKALKDIIRCISYIGISLLLRADIV